MCVCAHIVSETIKKLCDGEFIDGISGGSEREAYKRTSTKRCLQEIPVLPGAPQGMIHFNVLKEVFSLNRIRHLCTVKSSGILSLKTRIRESST